MFFDFIGLLATSTTYRLILPNPNHLILAFETELPFQFSIRHALKLHLWN